MLIADGGGSVRLPVSVPNPVKPAQQQQGAGSAESDAAARARELQRQLEALLEKLREAQRQAEEARKRAIEAQRKAREAREHAEKMEAQAQRTKELADATKAKKAQQEAKLEDARAKEASAQAGLKDKEVTLLNAQVEQKREQKKSPEAKASAAADKKVADAQGGRDEAQRTAELSKLQLDAEQKESKAQDAEAKVAELTPVAGRPSSTVTKEEWSALDDAREKAKTLRGEADAAAKKFAGEVGEEANTELWGEPPAPTPATTLPIAVAPADDPLQTPLTQLLQVAPPGQLPLGSSSPLLTPTLATATPDGNGSGLLTANGGSTSFGTSPLLQKAQPAVTPEVRRTLTDIADGKSVEQIAADRRMRVDQVLSEASAAGVKISTEAPKEGVQATTIQRGEGTLTYSRNTKDDTLTVTGRIADPKAPGQPKTIDAKEEGGGRYSRTTTDAKTGATTTTTIDAAAGTRTVSVVDKNGLRTDTTTSLTAAQVTRPVGDYEGYLEVAKAVNGTPEKLLALNPDVDYGKALKPGQELVVAGVPTTVKTFNKDGSTLEKSIAADGTTRVVATSAGGHRTVLMGEPDAKEGPGEAARKAIFDDRKSVADTAKSLGMTEDEVLAALPEGTVDVRKPTTDNGDVEIRTLYDPGTDRVVVETTDWQHGETRRKDIDAKSKFTVTQVDPKTGKSERVEVAGGVGYLQHEAEGKAKQVDALGREIAELDNTIRLYRRMGEPTTDLAARRSHLAQQQDYARGEATIAGSKATAALVKQQQVTIDEQARIAYQNHAYARPGSKDQAEAKQALDGRLELLDHVDRLVGVADKDVELAKAGLDQVKAQDAKAAADADLQAKFQDWKRSWKWNGLDEKEIRKREAEGQRPPGPMYRNAEEENEAAWKAFVQQQKMMDEHGSEYLTEANRPARDAWVARNRSSDAALAAGLRYDDASIASNAANTRLTQGEVDRLQQKKDAWTTANPTLFSENFGGQETLDKLQKTLADGKIKGLELAENKKHDEYLKTVSAPDRADPEALKKAEDKYAEDNQEAATRLRGQIKDLSEQPLRDKTRAVDDYIAQWGERNPDLKKALDAHGSDHDPRSLRAAEYRSGAIKELLSASERGRQMQSAMNLRYTLTDQLLKIGDQDDERLAKDLEGIKKGIEGHTWLRDAWGAMAGDSADDAKRYTEAQRKDARGLRDDLAAGRISVSDYARRENELMDGYDIEADKLADRVRDSDGTWSVVDDAVRMTVSAAAGIAATIASGGNVAVGFGVAMGVNQLWDTTGDIVAAAQGRDIYADGHSSLWTLQAKALTGNASWDDVKFTLKDELVDAATNAVTATGVGAGIKTSASVSAKLLANGTMVGSKGTLNLAGRAVVGARAGVVSQAVDGTGRVLVETGRVGLDGKLGTEEGDKRIRSTLVSSAAGLLTAPLTGGVSGAIPLWKGVPAAAQANAAAAGAPVKQQLTYFGLGAQFLNDGAAGLGTGDLIALANEGRHMNRGEFIAASLQVIPGTLNNVALHPAMAARARNQARAQAEAAGPTPGLLRPGEPGAEPIDLTAQVHQLDGVTPASVRELVVTDATLPHLLDGGDLPARAGEAVAPGGRVELHIALDTQKAVASAADAGSAQAGGARPGGKQRSADNPVPRKGEDSDIERDIDADQSAAIHERLRSAGFEQIRIERNPDAGPGEAAFVVHATKEGGEIHTDGVVPLLSRPVPAEPESQDTATAGQPDGADGGAADPLLPPPGSELHQSSWAGTLGAILRSGGSLRDTAYYLHASPYDEQTGVAFTAAAHGLPRPVASVGEGVAPVRYATLPDALAAARSGGGERATDGIALVYEPRLAADGSVPPEAVLATVHVDKTGNGPATLREVTQNPLSEIPATVALRVSYPVVQAATRPSGLVLPGSAARDDFLQVPDDATIYHVDRAGRVTQIGADDPRVAQALDRARQARARLLALPSREQGLDLDSLQAWREQAGMKPVDLRLVGPGEIPKGQGIYHRRDGVALVERDPAAEALHGSAPTLRAAAHELGHGNENQRQVFVLRDHNDPETLQPTFVIEPMTGFLRFDPVQKRVTGLAFEEAYAEHKAQQFDEARFGPRTGDASFDGQLGRYRHADGRSLDHGAYTAVALDAVLRMNPEIRALMEQARFSSAAQERLVARLGDAFDALRSHGAQDLSTGAHQAWAEGLYDAVQNGRPLPKAPPEGPAPAGPVTLHSRPVQRAAGAGDDGLPLKPSAFGTDGDWMAAALHLEDTIAQQRQAGQGGELPPGMILSDADRAVTQALMRDPEPGSQECFVVSGRPPSKGIFGGDDVRAKRRDVFDTLEKAQEAVARRNDGAWIYRVAPEGGIGEMTRAGQARSHNILGAFYVGNDRKVFPVGIANPQFDRWDLSASAPAGRAHVYNAALTMPVGRPAEGIFRQGGIEEGADAAIAAIERAVAEGRPPRVMIAAGYTIENGRAETSGPGGAAVAGKAARMYAGQTHGVDAEVVYVAAGRRQRKVLEAALDALGERKGEHYSIVSFNARGRLAEWRSSVLLRRHQPDLLMGFDVPGRTEQGEYRNSHGQAIGYHTAARDQLFIDATRNDRITTVAGFDLGNEVGGGHPDVHTRVQPAPDGTPIASIVTADVAMTGGRTNWVGYAFGTEVLRRAGALSVVPDERTVRSMVMGMMKAGGIDSETRSRVPFSTDARGRTSGVGGMSPDVEAAVAAMLRVRAEKIQQAPAIDLRGVRLRLGVFDSGSGGIIAAAEIKRVVEETTGARVDLVMVGDHGAGTYGPKTKQQIADHTRAGLETLDKLGVDLIVMACNTACTSGKGEYARGIKAPVIDLIDSTRAFHKGLVDQGERVVAFSTEASATLPLPGTDLIGVYRDRNVLPVGGTDDGFDVASIVNQYMADPMDAGMRARMQAAADHYADKILAADPEVTTVSWCCTHYPELEPFFARSLVERGRGEVKMTNPMANQALRAIEVAAQLPPGTGTGPSRAIGITTAVADKAEAVRNGVDPSKATVQQSEVLATLRIALQRDDVTLVPLERLGRDVEVAEAQRLLERDEAGDPIDALQAFDPSGRGFPIHVPGGAHAAARMLGEAGRVAVVAGFPIRTAAGRVAPESDSTKGAAVLAAGLAKLGKDTTCITLPANVKPLKAALAVLGRDDIEVRAFGLQIGPHAKSEALRMLRDLEPDAIVSVEAPGRDASGQYWSSTGERITGHVAALDEFFYAAREINGERADGAAKIRQIAILDVGNEVGGGNVDKRVRRAPDGQRIASEVTADQLVTAGVGSWGADATVAALEVLHQRADLLPTADQVRRVMRAITREGGVDSQSRTGIDHAAGYEPTVHVGMTELYRQAALQLRADGGPPDADGGGAAPPKGVPPKPGGPGPAEPRSAAFRGDEWPDVHRRLTSGGFGNDNIYVYRVKGQPDLYADAAEAVDLTRAQIDGQGRVARGTDTVRWYGNSTPGEGFGGLMPRREMGAKFGLEPKAPKETVWRIKDRETGEITRQTEKPTREQRQDPNLLIRASRVRPPREARPQPDGDWFVVSNQSPTRVDAANGLRGVTRGDEAFTLGSIEKKPTLPGGWGLGKTIKRQITLGLVAAVGITTANAISPIDTGHDVPSGVVGLPRNPIPASAPQHPAQDGFSARPAPFSVAAEVTLGLAQHQQRDADALARQPGADPAELRTLQTRADGHWGAFSAEMLKAIRAEAQRGTNPVAAANRQRAKLIALGKFDARSDLAVRDALRDSGLLKGTSADVEAQMDYARLVAEHPALVGDKSRELARQDPAAFATATLIEIGPDGRGFQSLVEGNAAMLGRLHAEGVVTQRLAEGDVAGASKAARQRLDAAQSAGERDKAMAGLRPLFERERTHALALLEEMPMQDVGDYLAQYRDAPPEVAEPVAKGVFELLQRGRPAASADLASMAQFEKFVEGLAIVADAADARAPTAAWSERFAGELLKDRFAGRPEFAASLPRAIEGAVVQGGAKLPVALANRLGQPGGDGALRDGVLAGIDQGLQAQQQHLGEAIGNLRGTAGYNATGASMAFYVANFSDGTPQGIANAIAQYRRVNPEAAAKSDEATRVVGEWGRALAQTHESLNGLRVAARSEGAEQALEGTVKKVYDSDDVKLAIAQSPQLRQTLLARETQGVPDPRTMTEYLINPVMFVTRHVSGTTRMVWSMVADAQFNGMVADPASYAKRWDAFRTKTEKMANVLGLNADEVRRGTAIVDEYVAKAGAVDPNLPNAARIDEFARLGAELDGKLQKLLGVGAKTVNNATNANTAFGQALRWVANAGFVTHNVSTELTNLRPLADGVQDYTQWYHRIYAPTQAFFMAKPYTTLMAERSLAGNRVIDGAAADIEGKMAWKYVFGLGTAGVGVADLSLAVGQAKTVPAWVTYTNIGMGVGGVVDGGVGLINVTGAALTRAGAVELGALLAIPGEIATIGGLGVAVFTGIKQFYNIAHHYDQVDAREAQRDPALRNALLDRGFSEAQAKAMLDCTHEGVSPMVAWNALMKSEGKSVEEGLALLRERLGKDGPQGIPTGEWVRVMHGLTDDRMNDNDGSFPAGDPQAARAGQTEVRFIATRGGAVRTESVVQPQSIEGLANYAREAWQLRI